MVNAICLTTSDAPDLADRTADGASRDHRLSAGEGGVSRRHKKAGLSGPAIGWQSMEWCQVSCLMVSSG